MGNYLIIGASTGIGKQLASELSEKGHNVIGTYNNTVNGHAADASYHQLDVTAGALDLSMIPEVLDGLIYCPGSINLKPFARIKPESFLEDYNLQVVGAIKVIQAALPALKKSDMASVVLFSTVAVQSGFPFHSQVSASKGAVEGLTKALAAELAPKIRVNCVAPSLTDTPLAAKILSNEDRKEANGQRHPLKRVGRPQDISAMVRFLLSDEASWMSGQVLHVDGGMSTLKV